MIGHPHHFIWTLAEAGEIIGEGLLKTVVVSASLHDTTFKLYTDGSLTYVNSNVGARYVWSSKIPFFRHVRWTLDKPGSVEATYFLFEEPLVTIAKEALKLK